MDPRTFLAVAILATFTGCVSPGKLAARPEAVVVTPDRPEDPGVVRFDVPTAMLMGLPGDPVPLTLEARRSTRELAGRELARRGWCPRGFAGPESIAFPGGDRGRSVFEVTCGSR